MMINHLKTNVLKLQETFFLLIKNPIYLLVPVLIDLLFLLSIGAAGSYILAKAIPFLERFATMNTASLDINSLSNSDMSSFISQTAEKTFLSNQVLIIFAEFAIVLLVLLIVFQGLNWLLAAKLIKNKISLKNHFLNFSISSLIGFIMALIAAILLFRTMLGNLLNQNNIMANFIVNILFLIVSSLLFYFLFIAYSISGSYKTLDFLKKVFSLGIKDFKNIISAYFLLIIIFMIASCIIRLFTNPILIFAYGIIIIMPLLAFSRTYLIKIIEK